MIYQIAFDMLTYRIHRIAFKDPSHFLNEILLIHTLEIFF